jgi:hypothetical protein
VVVVVAVLLYIALKPLRVPTHTKTGQGGKNREKEDGIGCNDDAAAVDTHAAAAVVDDDNNDVAVAVVDGDCANDDDENDDADL